MIDTYFLNFGKHNGRQLSEVPRQYLNWLWDQNWLHYETRKHLAMFLGHPIPKKVTTEDKVDEAANAVKNRLSSGESLSEWDVMN